MYSRSFNPLTDQTSEQQEKVTVTAGQSQLPPRECWKNHLALSDTNRRFNVLNLTPSFLYPAGLTDLREKGRRSIITSAV